MVQRRHVLRDMLVYKLHRLLRVQYWEEKKAENYTPAFVPKLHVLQEYHFWNA